MIAQLLVRLKIPIHNKLKDGNSTVILFFEVNYKVSDKKLWKKLFKEPHLEFLKKHVWLTTQE